MALDGDKVRLFGMSRRTRVARSAGPKSAEGETIREPLADGLYADVGAEHFTKPGYTQYWRYVEKFNLPAMAWNRRQNMYRKIDGEWYTDFASNGVEHRKGGGRFHRGVREVGDVVVRTHAGAGLERTSCVAL